MEVENCICLPSSLPHLCPLCSPSSAGTFLVLLCRQVSHQGCVRAQKRAMGSLESKKQEIMASYWAASKLSPFQGFSRITGQAHTQAERHEKQAVGMGEGVRKGPGGGGAGAWEGGIWSLVSNKQLGNPSWPRCHPVPVQPPWLVKRIYNFLSLSFPSSKKKDWLSFSQHACCKPVGLILTPSNNSPC